MRVSIIVAAARNGVIGRNGEIPWRLPDDQRFFKKMTIGHCVVMGRTTFEGLGRPLADRVNFVLSRHKTAPANPSDPNPNVEFFADLPSAIARARKRNFEECFIAGGEAIYREAVELADRIYLTRVDAEPEGDTLFPAIDESNWTCVESDARPSDKRNDHPFVFETWDRQDSAGAMLGGDDR
jgi:dihydrofolate reductase